MQCKEKDSTLYIKLNSPSRSTEMTHVQLTKTFSSIENINIILQFRVGGLVGALIWTQMFSLAYNYIVREARGWSDFANSVNNYCCCVPVTVTSFVSLCASH